MSSYIPAAYSEAHGSPSGGHLQDPSSSHTNISNTTTPSPRTSSRDVFKSSSQSPSSAASSDGVPSNATPAGEPYASAAAAAASEATHTHTHTHTNTDTHTRAEREEGDDARTHAKDVMDATRAVSRGLVGDVETWVQAARAARKGDVHKAQTLLEGKSKGPHVGVGTKIRRDREGRVLRSWEFLNDAGDMEVDTYKYNEARLTGRYEKETLLYPRPQDQEEEGTLQQEYGGFVF